MGRNDKVSRRTVVIGLASAPALSSASMAAEPTSPDTELIGLGRELESIVSALDRAGEHDHAMVLLDRIDTLSAAIIAIPAKSVEGLRVKARATAWALENDCGFLDPMKESSINDRLAASIVRDLLKLGGA